MDLLVNWYRWLAPTSDYVSELIRSEAFLHRDSTPTADVEGVRYAKQVKDSFNLAREKGVKIALGLDTVYEPITIFGEYSALEFKQLIKSGMSIPEAIKAATLTAAEALGMSHKIGTVEEGKNADLLVIKKDPTSSAEVLYNPENIVFIILNGRLAVEEGRLAY